LDDGIGDTFVLASGKMRACLPIVNASEAADELGRQSLEFVDA
jgi:hypothetical protein